MKIVSILIVSMCILLISLTPFPLDNQDGVYNTFSRLYWCSNRTACLHEIGHKLDQGSGWRSNDEKFKDAVKIYILAESKNSHPSKLLYILFSQADFTYSELYAVIFSYSDGKPENLPPVFREFYDWKMASEYIKK